MTTQEYVQHKGLQVTNKSGRIRFNVADGQTKADLQNAINEMSDLLDTAYASESSQRLGG